MIAAAAGGTQRRFRIGQMIQDTHVNDDVEHLLTWDATAQIVVYGFEKWITISNRANIGHASFETGHVRPKGGEGGSNRTEGCFHFQDRFAVEKPVAVVIE